MTDTLKKAHVILIGCGPHAKRVYIPALSRIGHIKLDLVIDLKSQEAAVRPVLAQYPDTELWLIEPFAECMPADLWSRLSNFVREHQISGVIIATEPLTHKVYAEWALLNELNILIDKPITTRENTVSDLDNAEGILDDYVQLLGMYKTLQAKKETIFMVNSQRRFHKGFKFVKDQIHDVALKTNCPVTFIQAYHCDGQWRFPGEIVTQHYHPYRYGYGKASHSGYHLFDTVYQFYKAAALPSKAADSMEIVSSFIQPNGFLMQFNQEDYRALFGEQYDNVSQWTDLQLTDMWSHFGEIDLSSIITLKKNETTVANFSINLIHNGFAGRTWLIPGQDLYKGNGRIKHESYYIQQGPFQSIQIHAYQASDKQDTDQGAEDGLGGKNHFDIYVFRNPLLAGSRNQPEVYMMKDLPDDETSGSGSIITMEWVKFSVVKEFADYLVGQKSKTSINSQIEDHLIPVQIMSGIYCSHVNKVRGMSGVVKLPFGKPVNQPVSG